VKRTTFFVLMMILGSFFLTRAFALESDESITVLQGLQQDSENFSTLVSLLETSGLTEQLQSGIFTLFAPTNAAFESYANGDLESISTDPNAVRQLLNLHVLEGAYTVNQLQDAEEGSLLTLEGQPMLVETTAGGLTVNGVGLTSTDVDNLYSNGVIHVVDTVMNLESNQTAIPTQ
jgi:uncharacterized surface protein with fasciclin (FAS1) repeats